MVADGIAFWRVSTEKNSPSGSDENAIFRTALLKNQKNNDIVKKQNQEAHDLQILNERGKVK